MSATPTAASSKPRTKPARTLFYNAAAGALFITVGKEEFGYWLDALPHDLGPAVRCYRLTKFVATRKAGQPDFYDVQVNAAAASGECECLGHLRHGHKTVCKHVAALLRLLESGRLS